MRCLAVLVTGPMPNLNARASKLAQLDYNTLWGHARIYYPNNDGEAARIVPCGTRCAKVWRKLDLHRYQLPDEAPARYDPSDEAKNTPCATGLTHRKG